MGSSAGDVADGAAGGGPGACGLPARGGGVGRDPDPPPKAPWFPDNQVPPDNTMGAGELRPKALPPDHSATKTLD